jgi:hypothetical protein
MKKTLYERRKQLSLRQLVVYAQEYQKDDNKRIQNEADMERATIRMKVIADFIEFIFRNPIIRGTDEV